MQVIKKILLVSILALMLSCNSKTDIDIEVNTSSSELVPPNNLILFPLLGQSNMSGRGLMSAAPASLTTPNSSIFVYANDGTWQQAVEPIDSAVGQIDTVSKDSGAAVGPAMAFALAYLASHPGVNIGLIPCANGGKTIHEWRRQSLTVASNSTLIPLRSNLYGSCYWRIKEAEQSGTVKALLIYEGESDTRDPSVVYYSQPFTFADEFERFVTILRADLFDPNLPVLFAQLATTTDTSLVWWDLVKDQQEIAANRLGMTAMIKTEDLTLNSDGLHLTTASQIILGQRFADKLLNLE